MPVHFPTILTPGTPNSWSCAGNQRVRQSGRLLPVLVLLLALAGLDDTTELELAGELLLEAGVHLHQALDDVDESLLRGDLAVGLAADKELRHIRVGD